MTWQGKRRHHDWPNQTQLSYSLIVLGFIPLLLGLFRRDGWQAFTGATLITAGGIGLGR